MSPAAAITGSPPGGGGGGGGEPPVSTTSWGRLVALSRLAQLMALALDVASATDTLPFPLTSGVTSSDVVDAAATFPDEAVALDAGAGALLQVIVFSPHVVFATPNTE